jgi:diguanylate cyclase (GGDEF)-like protein/PAS domain S-box-containing protein
VAVLRTAKGSARQSRRLWRALPFGVCAAAAGLATLAFPPYRHETGHLVVAGLLTVVCVLLACRPAESSASLMAAPACFFLVVAVLRDGSGGSDSGLAPLVVLPILWVALNGRRLEMFLAAGLTAVLFVVPLVLVGQPEYDASDWRRAALYTLIAAVIGPVVQGVVRRLEAGEREALEARAYADGILAAATEHSIIATDLDGLIVTFNAGAERMLGYTAEEMIGKQSPVILHDHDEVVARAAELGIEPGLEVFVREARRGRTETREWTFIAKDGHRVPVRLSLSGIKDTNGQVTGFMGLARDISGWKQALSELAAAEARWRVLFDHLPDTAVLVVNDELRYVAAAGAGLVEQGYTDITGKRLDDVVAAADRDALAAFYRSAVDGQEGRISFTSSKTGRSYEVDAVPLPRSEHAGEAMIVARDVTVARHREAQLAEAKEQFASLFEEAPFGVMVLDLDGVVLDVNPAICGLTGRTLHELVGRPASVAGGNDRRLAGLLRHLRNSPAERVSGESQIRHRTGAVIDIAFAGIVLHDADGTPQRILLNAVDITERRQLERRLAHLADHDPLTGLANRRRFDADLERHLELCGRYGPRGALLMLDLDHFKEVNETLGHRAGDELIESVTALLEQRMRKSDTVARFGGDEFVVLLPEADRVAAEQVATDIVELVRERAEFADGTRPLRISASVGVVLIDRADVTAERLMSTVDVTMYDAKESGRDRWVLNRLPQVEPRVI